MSKWIYTNDDGDRVEFEADDDEVEALVALQEADDEDDDEDGDDSDGEPQRVEDTPEEFARVEAAYRKERAAIRASGDATDLRLRRQALERVLRNGQQSEIARARARDLLDEIEQRELRIRAEREAENRAKAHAAARAKEAMVKADNDRRSRTPPSSVGQTRVQPARAERQADPAERAASTRLANAQAAKIEAEAELLRAQAKAALEAAIARPVRVGREPRSAQLGGTAASKPTPASAADKSVSSPPRVSKGKVAPVEFAEIDGYNEADRLALVSVGYWPPTPPDHRGAFWTRDADWPAAWTLTGMDLARLRTEINLTRAVFAGHLGVPSSAIKDAEGRLREKVGPALQISLRRAMEHQVEHRRRRRDERMAAQAVPVDAPLQRMAEIPAMISVDPAITTPAGDASSSTPVFTGADLSRLRTERGLSQREMAEILGVEQGTVSKGEGKADAALGPALQGAVSRTLAAGNAASAAVIPE